MSGKGRVRRTRRTNTNDEDHEVKLDDLIDQSDDNKSTVSNETDKLDTSLKEETNGHDLPKTDTEKDNKTATETISLSPTKPDAVAGKTNGQPDVIDITDSPAEKPETVVKNGEDQSSEDMEPLNVDSEDPELQFTSEQNSDKSSEVESSPILNRCRTRRSHTRNLPTPKTPKVLDLNGDIDESTEKSEIKSVSSQSDTPEIIITVADDTEENSENVSLASNVSVAGSVGEKTLDSDLANASIFVNFGNDTTKNFDITVQSNLDDETGQNISNFLETTKDKSYGETLRCLTGRKTARNFNIKPRMYSSTMELHSKDVTDSYKKYTPLAGVKRKLDAEMPSDKRMRTEDVSPGILSYLTSPFKSKVAVNRTEVSSSTPKLTSFKYVHHGSTVIDEVSKVGLENDDKQTEPKKWCSIM